MLGSLLGGCAGQSSLPAESVPAGESMDESAVLARAENFFGRGAQGLADVVNRVFNDKGPPAGYIRGQESGGAFGLGLRYGSGTLFLANGDSATVYWRGPSLGVDIGANAAKVFMLVYDVSGIESIYGRYSGVEGSVYFVGGVSVTYNNNADTVLAPVRFGVGWRQGINVGYLQLSPERAWRPF